MAAARIVLGLQDKLVLGNLDAKRDWGYAPEYCEGMWRILQHDTAEDFVLATGKTHTIREFCELAFAELGIELEWQGEGVNEKGIVRAVRSPGVLSSLLKVNTQTNISRTNQELRTKNIELPIGSVVIEVSPKYFRPTEVELLIGNPAKAKEILGWQTNTNLAELVKIMVESDFKGIFQKI